MQAYLAGHIGSIHQQVHVMFRCYSRLAVCYILCIHSYCPQTGLYCIMVPVHIQPNDTSNSLIVMIEAYYHTCWHN